jgi:hypothetical protein
MYEFKGKGMFESFGEGRFWKAKSISSYILRFKKNKN